MLRIGRLPAGRKSLVAPCVRRAVDTAADRPASLTPLTLRGVTPNRLTVPPMCQYWVSDGFVGDHHLAHPTASPRRLRPGRGGGGDRGDAGGFDQPRGRPPLGRRAGARPGPGRGVPARARERHGLPGPWTGPDPVQVTRES